jgi:probable F420-dependent oxidoreductase
MGACATADGVRRISSLAEETGYDSLWMGEHLVQPSPRVPPAMTEPDYPILDPVVSLAVAAAETDSILLATGIVILPQRNPVVLAKELASLDVLSRGRLVLGVGVGYVKPEMDAVGVPMEGRGARAVEYLAAMRELWTSDAPSFAGEHVSFTAVDAHPKPVQDPIPVVFGGHTAAAHRRAVHHGDGWYGFMLDLDATAAQLESLRREADAAGRDVGELSITVSPSVRVTPDVAQAYGELGVDRLAIVPPPAYWQPDGWTLDELETFVRSNAVREAGQL